MENISAARNSKPQRYASKQVPVDANAMRDTPERPSQRKPFVNPEGECDKSKANKRRGNKQKGKLPEAIIASSNDGERREREMVL
jgi:hypothetical protein